MSKKQNDDEKYKYLLAWCKVLDLPSYVIVEHIKTFKKHRAPAGAVFRKYRIEKDDPDMKLIPDGWMLFKDVDGETKRLMEVELGLRPKTEPAPLTETDLIEDVAA